MTPSCKLSAYGVAIILCIAGCRRSDGLLQITGAVTYDGQPLQNGTISFLPSDGRGPTAAAIIAEGNYSVKVAPGPKHVRIESYKVVGRRHYVPNDPTSPMVDIQKQILPECYNTKTNLTREIIPTVGSYAFVLEKSPAVRP